jgi:hypothetical protein
LWYADQTMYSRYECNGNGGIPHPKKMFFCFAVNKD